MWRFLHLFKTKRDRETGTQTERHREREKRERREREEREKRERREISIDSY